MRSIILPKNKFVLSCELFKTFANNTRMFSSRMSRFVDTNNILIWQKRASLFLPFVKKPFFWHLSRLEIES